MMRLSPHFSLEELVITQVRGVDNTPSPLVVAHLTEMAKTLERVRYLFGNAPIHINSGYRSPEVNARVGGVPHSAHLSGWAADFICPEYGTPLEICQVIAGSDLLFDQMINEGAKGASLGWVHLSVDPRMRGQILTANFNGGQASYTPGLPDAGQNTA